MDVEDAVEKSPGKRRLPLPSPLRAVRTARGQRLLADKSLLRSLVSVSCIVGAPVCNNAGRAIGRLRDVVVEWEDESGYPAVKGLVAQVARRATFVHAAQLDHVRNGDIRLRSAKVTLDDYTRRPGEVLLAADVLDHQLVDIDGIRVVRASDLYLVEVERRLRLVGVDVGMRRLLRRMTPGGARKPVAPDRVLDWAAIQPFAAADDMLRLRRSNKGLEFLAPSELAELLEQLGRSERQGLLSVLGPDTAADALEEMEPEEAGALLRDAAPERAAELLSAMEPDEAVDALRELDTATRMELLDTLPPDESERLALLLAYPSGTAGGVMTPKLVVARQDETVALVRARLAEQADDRAEIDAVIVVDDDGLLYHDVRMFELFIAEGHQQLVELCLPPRPPTVGTEADLAEVVERFTETRRSSVVVVDDAGRPVGRILADDLVDALAPARRARLWGLRP